MRSHIIDSVRHITIQYQTVHTQRDGPCDLICGQGCTEYAHLTYHRLRISNGYLQCCFQYCKLSNMSYTQARRMCQHMYSVHHALCSIALNSTPGKPMVRLQAHRVLNQCIQHDPMLQPVNHDVAMACVACRSAKSCGLVQNSWVLDSRLRRNRVGGFGLLAEMCLLRQSLTDCEHMADVNHNEPWQAVHQTLESSGSLAPYSMHNSPSFSNSSCIVRSGTYAYPQRCASNTRARCQCS